MIKKTFTFFLILLLTSCAIEEIPRQPLLTTPLGLRVKRVPESGPVQGLGLFFFANNPEIYFTGFSIFVSTQKEDFGDFQAGEVFFPLVPVDVPGNQALLLTNYIKINNTNITIFKGGQMSFPERDLYPVGGENLGIADGSPNENPDFTFTSFTALPEKLPKGDPPPPTADYAFKSGTTYYFGVYAYSSVDDAYSLPSNIAEIKYP